MSFIGFKGPLGFYENTSDSYTALEKTEENQRKLKQINEIVKVGKIRRAKKCNENY